MNCANHPELPAAAYCRECGKAMCEECQRPALGSIFCVEHLPGQAAPPPAANTPEPVPPEPQAWSAPASPYSAPPPAAPPYESGAHPALALMLGFIPGVGAIYNGQYAKGLIHAVVFGLLISSINMSHGGAFEPLLAILIAGWVFYMAFEAYHTARKRRFGVEVEEFSSLFDVRPAHGRFPGGAILLIGLGFILLLDTTDVINMEQLARYWPVGLIVAGFYMLYSRLSAGPVRTDYRETGRRAEIRK